MKAKETVIDGWVARDRDNDLWLFDEEPWEDYSLVYESYMFRSNGNEILLPKKSMPDLTYEKSPKKVRITITPIEE